MSFQSQPVWYSTLSATEKQELERNDGLVHPTPDVLVIGGGIIGLAIAQALAATKLKVQLVERGTLLSEGATAASAGGIWPADQGPFHPEVFGALALRSRDLWGRLSLKPGFDFDWRVNGFVTVNPARFGNDAYGFALRAQDAGYTVHAIDSDQVAQLEPQLARAPAGGIHCPSDAHLNPLKAAASLAQSARRFQAKLATRSEVVGLKRNGSRIIEIETTSGVCQPGAVVHCTGSEVKLESGDIRPVSGQMISTGPLPPLLKSTIGGEFLTLQLKSGEIVTGGSMAENASLVPDLDLADRMAAAARRLIPALKDVPFTRLWCGVRSTATDGLPIIDRAPQCENEWYAVGHHRNGILLAPVTAELLTRWMTTSSRPEELAPFGWRSKGV